MLFDIDLLARSTGVSTRELLPSIGWQLNSPMSIWFSWFLSSAWSTVCLQVHCSYGWMLYIPFFWCFICSFSFIFSLVSSLTLFCSLNLSFSCSILVSSRSMSFANTFAMTCDCCYINSVYCYVTWLPYSLIRHPIFWRHNSIRELLACIK